MLKKSVTYILFSLCIMAFGAYLWGSRNLHAKGAEKEMCTDVRIEILDSCSHKLISAETVLEMINRLGNPVGENINDVDVFRLEQGITGLGAVRNTEVAIDRTGTVHVLISQRHPILRFQSQSYGYYMDDTGFCFPLSDLFTSDVPVVSGQIREDDLKWRDGMLELGRFLDNDRVWKTQIEQIDVSENGHLTLYSRTSDQKIAFGKPEGIESKFSRLLSFYKNIAPNYGWEYYSTVNLSYSGQIVCTRSEK